MNWHRRWRAWVWVPSASSIALLGCTSRAGRSDSASADTLATGQTGNPAVKAPVLAGSYDTSKAGIAALSQFVGRLKIASTHKIRVPAVEGCGHPHVRLSVSAYTGVGSTSFADYASNSTYPIAEITNESNDCYAAGLKLAPQQKVLWTVNSGTFHFTDIVGGTGDVSFGPLGHCTNGTHHPMGDHALPKAKVDACDHKKPGPDDPPELVQPVSFMPAMTQIDDEYILWVNCSDTCCYADPGYPLENKVKSAPNPPKKNPKGEKKA